MLRQWWRNMKRYRRRLSTAGCGTLLPQSSASVLDIGAGSGRDAAWLAANGHDVIAVEPSAPMRAAAASLHDNPAINWIDDRLPALGAVSRSGLSFDLILLSAVWMHVPESDRPRAFRKMINLLRPGGLMAITLRLGSGGPRKRFPRRFAGRGRSAGSRSRSVCSETQGGEGSAGPG